jgi:alginate O-acetyltransferase complex protein AlgI
LLTNKNRKNLEIVAQNKKLPSFKDFFLMFFTFALTVLAWIFFRADNIDHAISYISIISSSSLFSIPKFYGMEKALITLLLVIIFLIIEWVGRREQFALQNIGIKWKTPYRYTIYYAIIIAIFWFGGKEQQFIYFQF